MLRRLRQDRARKAKENEERVQIQSRRPDHSGGAPEENKIDNLIENIMQNRPEESVPPPVQNVQNAVTAAASQQPRQELNLSFFLGEISIPAKVLPPFLVGN